MGRKKGTAKSKTEKAEAKEAKILGDEFLNELNSADEEKLRSMSATVTEDRVKFSRVRDADMDLKAAKMAAATANAPYKEGFKRFDVKAKWITARLESMGKDVGSGDYDMDEDDEDAKLSDEQVNELGGPKVLTPPDVHQSPWSSKA